MSTRRVPTFVVAAVAVIALTAWLGQPDLLDPDEARHAEIAREMLASGHYLTPRLEGVPYYDKPVFFHWAVAASMHLFGMNAAAARLPSVLSALWVLVVVGWWARRAYSAEAAKMAVAGLATMLGFVAIGRYVIIDMMFTAVITTALAWLGAWYLDDSGCRRSVYPFYVLTGLGMLIKGPVAIILCALVALGLLVGSRTWATLRDLRPARGACLVLLVAAPWYLLAWKADPAYVETFLWRHNLLRYAVAGTVGHQGPWYYYLVALPLGFLPWTALLPFALISRLSARRRTRADVYCALWAGVVLGFFAPAQAKLLTYVLPAFVPLACMTGAFLAAELERLDDPSLRLRRLAQASGLGWTGLTVLLAGAGVLYLASHDMALSKAITVAVSMTAVLALSLRVRRDPVAMLAVTAFSAIGLILAVYGLAAGTLSELKSLRPAAELVRRVLPVPPDLFRYRCSPHGLAFYAEKTVREVYSPSEARRRMRGPEPAALLIKEKYLAEIGLDPAEQSLLEAWRGRNGLLLLVHQSGQGRVDGGEGRESNPPPAMKGRHHGFEDRPGHRTRSFSPQ